MRNVSRDFQEANKYGIWRCGPWW